jgi:tripartite-type tricarboxylate transporter receptor subunit TctC
MNSISRLCLCLCIGVTILAQSVAAQAQSAARSALTLVVPYPAGGTTDQVARMLIDALGAELGQPVVIDNRGGSAGNVGAAHVARSNPDGSTVLLATNAVVTMNPFMYKSINFDPVKDFTAISGVTQGVIGIAVNAELPIHSVKDLVEYARKNPGKVTFGTPGTGSPQHVTGELLNQRGGVKMIHVPYRGGGPMMSDLIGGHINVGIIVLSAILPQLDSKKIRLIAIAEKSRFGGAPDTPTVAETFPGFEVSAWFGLFGPAGMSPAVVSRLNSAIGKVLQTPEIRKKLEDLAIPPSPGTPEQLAQQVKTDLDRWGKLFKEIGLKAE